MVSSQRWDNFRTTFFFFAFDTIIYLKSKPLCLLTFVSTSRIKLFHSKVWSCPRVGTGRRRSGLLCPGPEAASSKLMNEHFCGARKVIHKNSAPLAPCLPPPKTQVSLLRGPNYEYLKKVINKSEVKSWIIILKLTRREHLTNFFYFTEIKTKTNQDVYLIIW